VSDFKDRLKDRVRSSPSVHSQLIDSIDPGIPTKKRKVKFEEKYTRATFYIENDLLKELDKEARDEKGEKTRIVNEAIRKYLKEM